MDSVSYESYDYEHVHFRSGLHVRIDPVIRNVHPMSPIAGLIGVTCLGKAYRVLDQLENQTAYVPVQFLFPDGVKTYYVEEQFVFLVPSVRES